MRRAGATRGGDGPDLSAPAVSGSTELTTGFDTPVLSLVEGLRMNASGKAFTSTVTVQVITTR